MTELSREAILAMGPGRELDALITTKVMGLGQWHTFSEVQKPYSTDLTAAWEVVEKMQENWIVKIYDCGPFGWRVDLLSDSPERADVAIGRNGYTAPEAICKAALLTTLEEAQHDPIQVQTNTIYTGYTRK